MTTREDELKRGCGNENGGYKCGFTKFVKREGIFLCPTCKSKLRGFQEGKSSARQDEIKFLKDYLEMLNVPDYAFKISDFDKKRKIREKIAGVEEMKIDIKIEDVLNEMLSIKENYVRDLKECATKQPIKHWIWVGATIDRLEKEIIATKKRLQEIKG